MSNPNTNDLPEKLELALISYLFLFGGCVPRALLDPMYEGARFDNLGWFNPNPVAVRKQLPQWQGVDWNPFQGCTWYPGHCAIDMEDVPRIIVTAAQAGGDGSYAGYDDCTVEVLVLSAAADATGQASRRKAVRDILQAAQLWAIKAELNAWAYGNDDTRAVQGFGLDSLNFKDSVEGRDDSTNQHGTRMNFEVGAHLEPM